MGGAAVVDATAGAGVPTRTLVLGMAQEDGTIAAGHVYDAAAACGQTVDQVRSCLRRLVSEGLFTRVGEGRAARFLPTPAGQARLAQRLERTRRAFQEDAAGRGWDGIWHLAVFAVPEAERPARATLRDRLIGLGGAAVHGGVYVAARGWEDEVRGAAAALGVQDHLTLASTGDLEMGGVRGPRELARRLWPLDAVDARYRAFLEAFGSLPDELEAARRARQRLSNEAFVSLALRMWAALVEAARADPLLPPELLPRPWSGRAARDVARRSRRQALLSRAEAGQPALFGAFDRVLDRLPPL